MEGRIPGFILIFLTALVMLAGNAAPALAGCGFNSQYDWICGDDIAPPKKQQKPLIHYWDKPKVKPPTTEDDRFITDGRFGTVDMFDNSDTEITRRVDINPQSLGPKSSHSKFDMRGKCMSAMYTLRPGEEHDGNVNACVGEMPDSLVHFILPEGASLALEFDENHFHGKGFGQLQFTESTLGLSPTKQVVISKHPGDFTPVEMGCVKESLTERILIDYTGHMDDRICNLEPGRKYFMNIRFYSTVAGKGLCQDPPPGQGCAVIVRP